MKRESSWFAAMFGLLCIGGAAAIHPLVVRMRDEQLPQNVRAISGHDSPLVVFSTVAMGGLRGIVIDILWSRIWELQYDRREYVEIVQLSDWITRLDPKLGVVWDNLSFNMCYNISVMFADPSDRWRWVSNGMRMLRDEALAYNPGDVVLYDRLCRIYRHKMIDRSDTARDFYRVQWAVEMTDLFEGERPDFDRARSDAGYARRFREDYKLDFEIMADIDSALGPLDWRLPESHVIYWASAAIRAASCDQPGFEMMICEAMGEQLLQGRVTDFRPEDGVLATDMRPELIPAFTNEFESVAARYDVPLDASDLGFLYRLMLRRAVWALHNGGLDEEARGLLDVLAARVREPEASLPYEGYVELLRTTPEPQNPHEERRIRLLRERAEHHRHHHD